MMGESRAAVPPGAAVEGEESTDRAEMVDRVVKAARLAQSRGTARLRLTLNPPRLGELRVELTVRNHVLGAAFQAESAAARELILGHLESLKEALEAQGLQVGEFQVHVENGFAQAERGSEQAAGSAGAPPAAPLHEEADGPDSPAPRITDARLIDVMA
jgi:flagellar hook-length control protein FliK